MTASVIPAKRKLYKAERSFRELQTLSPGIPGSYKPFRIFTILWAIASLFHMAHSGVFDSQLNLTLLTIAALYAVFNPSLPAFLLLIVLQIFDTFHRMPHTTNHWLFTAFANLTMIQAFFYLMWQNKTFNVNESELFKAFAPVVRIEIFILYFFAVFHKLNSSFLNPDVSCAADLLKAQHLDTLITITPDIAVFNAYLTLMVEALIPIMLFFRRTRYAGMLVGIVFHLVLSYSTYNAFYDFTSMLVAVYFLFTDEELSIKVYDWGKSIRAKLSFQKMQYSLTRLIAIAGFLVLAIALLYYLNSSLNTFKLFHLYFFWTLYGAILLAFLIAYIWSKRDNQPEPLRVFSLPHASFAVIVLILFFNGMTPYLGLKTEHSYAMFSNLRTEGGISNHYIVPASSQIFDYQREVVEIISSTDERLQGYADEQKMMVLFEFKNYLQRARPREVQFLVNGKEYTYKHGITPMTGILEPNNALLSQLMKFRVFSKYEPQPCSH
jgi:hypothetical protein